MAFSFIGFVSGIFMKDFSRTKVLILGLDGCGGRKRTPCEGIVTGKVLMQFHADHKEINFICFLNLVFIGSLSQAAEETDRKLKVYAVEKNPNAVVTLHVSCPHRVRVNLNMANFFIFYLLLSDVRCSF